MNTSDLAVLSAGAFTVWLILMMYMLYKHPAHLVALMLFMMASVLAAVFYFLFLEPPYLVYRNIPFTPMVKTVHAGEVIPLQVSFCNNARKPTTYTLARSLQDVDTLALISMSDVLIRSVPGCRESVSLAHVVPYGVPPGNYRLIGQTEIEGTLRSHKIGWDSMPFEVMP